MSITQPSFVESAYAAGGDARPAEVPQGGGPEDGALVGEIRAELRRQAGGAVRDTEGSLDRYS